MQKKCRLIFLGTGLALWVWFSFAQASEISGASAEEFFLSAVDAYHAGDYAACRALLQTLEAAYPANELSAEVLFLSAKALQAEGYYSLAMVKLRTFLWLYPLHPQTSQVQKALEALKAKESRPGPVASPGQPIIRAAQISILRETSWEEVRQSFRALHRQGINTVILRVFHNAGDRKHALALTNSVNTGVYFDSKGTPVIADLLGPAAKIAHEEGLALWAWMNTRRADWWPDPALREWTYSLKTQTMAYSSGLSPFHGEALSRMRVLYRELACYPIDGILLQDDLNFRQWEGFSPEARKVFRQDGGQELSFYQLIKESPGTRPRSDSLFWRWSRWRQEKLLLYVEELITEAKEVRPALIFALNLPYETLTDPGGALSWFSLDFYTARNYPIDYFALMAYHRQMEKELKIPPKEVSRVLQKAGQEMVRALAHPQQALFKVQVLDWDTEEILPAEEVRAILETLVQSQEVSWALTPYRREVPLEAIVPFIIKK